MKITDVLFLYVLPGLVIALTFCLPRIRIWLDKRAVDAERQSMLVDQFQDEAARFLRLTEKEAQPILRNFVLGTGSRMLMGSGLVRSLLWSNERQARDAESPASTEKIDAELASLSDEARHALGKLSAAALLASSYQSVFFGHRLRNMLFLAFSTKDNEVVQPVEIKEPAQVVYRYAQRPRSWRATETADC